MTARKLEDRPIEQLIPYARNARTHEPAQVAQIAASIKEFGFTNPVLIDGANGIIAGHGRVLAARKLGMDSVPCIELAHLTDTQRRAYILADNKLALNAGWDAELLGLELQELQALDFDVALAGFGAEELAELLADKTEGLTDPDEVPEAPAEPVSVLGDVWVMGRHRVMCGDSVAITDVERLLSGTNADMVFTDPPYGVDEQTDRAFASRTRLARGGSFPKIIGDTSTKTAIDAYQLCEGLGIPLMIFWGANHYCHALPESGNWIVWDKRGEDKQRDMNSDAELAWVKSPSSSVRIFRHLWKGLIKASEHGEKRVHPTQKPIALAEWCLERYGKRGDVVVDLFGGSGSTLIACERTNRTAFLMELSPAYVDVAITRWQNFTGQQATLEADGRTFDEIAASARPPH